MRMERNRSLKELNTFGIEATAACYARVETVSELAELLRGAALRSQALFVLGGGSNVLFTGDFQGLVVHNVLSGLDVFPCDADHALVEAGAGVAWHDLVAFCVEQDLGGLENLSFIPGCVGASPIQNIGAYGVEIQDLFESLEALEIATGCVRRFTRAECRFGYRDSIFKREERGRWIILSVRLRLTTRNHRLKRSYAALDAELARRGLAECTLRDISDAVIAIRRSKLPDPARLGNAGSFFKNPEVSLEKHQALERDHPELVAYPAHNGRKLAAGWLIEQCGWKGKRVGNAGVHTRQALVLVNYGGATGGEILALAEQVQASVRERFGVELEPEVHVVR